MELLEAFKPNFLYVHFLDLSSRIFDFHFLFSKYGRIQKRSHTCTRVEHSMFTTLYQRYYLCHLRVTWRGARYFDDLNLIIHTLVHTVQECGRASSTVIILNNVWICAQILSIHHRTTILRALRWPSSTAVSIIHSCQPSRFGRDSPDIWPPVPAVSRFICAVCGGVVTRTHTVQRITIA